MFRVPSYSQRNSSPPQGDILNAIHGLIPGVRTRGRHEDTRLVVRGAEVDVIYVVDGKVIRPPLTFRIDVADVACIEVRKGFTQKGHS